MYIADYEIDFWMKAYMCRHYVHMPPSRDPGSARAALHREVSCSSELDSPNAAHCELLPATLTQKNAIWYLCPLAPGVKTFCRQCCPLHRTAGESARKLARVLTSCGFELSVASQTRPLVPRKQSDACDDCCGTEKNHHVQNDDGFGGPSGATRLSASREHLFCKNGLTASCYCGLWQKESHHHHSWSLYNMRLKPYRGISLVLAGSSSTKAWARDVSDGGRAKKD